MTNTRYPVLIQSNTYSACNLDEACAIAERIGASVLRWQGERYVRISGDWYVF